MQITGTQVISAPRQAVWDALTDPDVLKRTLPGCESVERLSAEEFKVIVAAAIGPLRARFNGMLTLSDVLAPESCTMVFEGQGGAVGFGKGNSHVKLSEVNGQTELTYTTRAQVGGKLAQVGSRLIDGVARKMADDFFAAFEEQFAGARGVDAGDVRTESSPAKTHLATQTPASRPPKRPLAEPLMVPAWWLIMAAVLGSLATIAGVLIGR